MRHRFGNRLRAIRTLRHLTQTELGQRADLMPAAISHFERGRRLPNMVNLIKLADALNCSADLFYPPKTEERKDG